MSNIKRIIIGACIAALTLTTLSGFIGSNAKSADSIGMMNLTSAVADEAGYDYDEVKATGTYGAAEDSANNRTDKPAFVSDRIMVKNAYLNSQTENYKETVSEIIKKVDSLKGYVESQNEFSMADERLNGELVLRIPSDKLEQFISYVEANTEVTNKNISSEDITDDYVNTDIRIKSLRTELDTLLSLLEKAQNLSDTIQIQDRITQVRGDLEYSEAMLKKMDSKVSYAQVSVNIEEVDRTATQGSGFFHDIKEGLKESLYNIVEGFKIITVWLVSSAPSIAITVLFAIIVYKIFKRGVNKWKTKKSSNSTSEGTNPQ